MDLKKFAIKYLELALLQQTPREELVKMVLGLQQQHQEMLELAIQSLSISGKRGNETEEMKKKLVETQAELDMYRRIADLKLGRTYDVNAPWIDKIVFVLKAAGRPLRSSEIISTLTKNDALFRDKSDRQKGLSAHLTKALKYGRIIGVKQKGQNGYLFSLPEKKLTLKESRE